MSVSESPADSRHDQLLFRRLELAYVDVASEPGLVFGAQANGCFDFLHSISPASRLVLAALRTVNKVGDTFCSRSHGQYPVDFSRLSNSLSSRVNFK